MKTPAEAARIVLRKFWNQTLPVDPELVAIRAGATVISDPSLEFDHGGLSGKFEYEGETPVIRYYPAEPPVRQRFTIAHELGHFVLGHKGVLRDPRKNFSLSNYDTREVAANKFAAEILMPKSAIKPLVVDRGVVNVTQLASMFHVSEVAMDYRLKNLGWVS